MQSILSGDPTKISAVLAPQISAAKTSQQQNTKTNELLGGRSGGTTALNATAADRTHAEITNMISSLTGGAASGLTSVGSGLLGTGIAGTSDAFGIAKQMQEQRAQKLNDIISSSAAVAGGIIGGIPGNPGGLADITSNVLGNAS